MFRTAQNSLKDWRNKNKFKPLLLTGARQVGKTWLMKNLGQTEFDNFIYINFEKQHAYKNLFEADLNTERIIQTLALMSNQKVQDGNTLLIFDEIQEAPNALSSLKYFSEDRPHLHVIAAGSLLGVTLDKSSFPVGKVEFLKINPMSFAEFLKATQNNGLNELLEREDFEVISSFKEQYKQLLRAYYLVGGMPEVVASFAENNTDYNAIKKTQENILNAYVQDFAKHAPATLIPKIINLWNSLVSQLAKENKKFIYGLVKSGARAREYEQAIDWLVNYGLVHQVFAINKVAFPLTAYRDLKSFKLYVSDVGLLSFMSNLNPSTVFNDDSFFQEFKGALTEQFVLQELTVANAQNISYWTNESGTAELDFLFENEGKIYPLEVKASENLQAKSLRIFHDKYPKLHCFRTSLSNYRKEEWMTNIPLYAMAKLWKK
jgi:predicted AAA+ superfamily ATPase